MEAAPECPLCLCSDAMLAEPTSLGCGHSFCLPCVRRALAQDEAGGCPICRQPVAVTPESGKPVLGVNHLLATCLQAMFPCDPAAAALQQLELGAGAALAGAALAAIQVEGQDPEDDEIEQAAVVEEPTPVQPRAPAPAPTVVQHTAADEAAMYDAPRGVKILEKQCGHNCELRVTPKCCACMDLRPVDEPTYKYLDGRTYAVCERNAHYCPWCAGSRRAPTAASAAAAAPAPVMAATLLAAAAVATEEDDEVELQVAPFSAAETRTMTAEEVSKDRIRFRVTVRDCGHECECSAKGAVISSAQGRGTTVRSAALCCICADGQSHEDACKRYVDGRGMVRTTVRHWGACPTCRGDRPGLGTRKNDRTYTLARSVKVRSTTGGRRARIPDLNMNAAYVRTATNVPHDWMPPRTASQKKCGHACDTSAIVDHCCWCTYHQASKATRPAAASSALAAPGYCPTCRSFGSGPPPFRARTAIVAATTGASCDGAAAAASCGGGSRTERTRSARTLGARRANQRRRDRFS